MAQLGKRIRTVTATGVCTAAVLFGVSIKETYVHHHERCIVPLPDLTT